MAAPASSLTSGSKNCVPVKCKHISPSRKHRRQIERLRVDGESLVAQANDVAAVFVQILAIFQLTSRIFANRLQPALQIFDANGIIQVRPIGR